MDTKLTIKLPAELRRRAKAVAALRDETLSDVIRAALQEYIDKAINTSEGIRLVREIENRIDLTDDDYLEWD